MFPILLALIMKAFLPSLQSMKLTIAVESGVEDWVVDELEKYAEVELFHSPEEVRERIERPDDIAGIIRGAEEYVVLLEGNEAGEAKEISSAIMNTVLSKGPQSQFEHISLGKTDSLLREIIASLLLLTASLIGGFAIGLNIVDEKETKAVKALAVSPLKTGEFLIAHLIMSLVIGIILAILSSLILVGTAISYWAVLIAIISTMGIAIILGYLIGGLADNMISAIAVIKVLMVFFLGIPIGSLFVPEKFQWFFYPFPHYWGFQAYRSIFNDGQQAIGFAQACIIALVTSSIIILFLTPLMRKRLKLR